MPTVSPVKITATTLPADQKVVEGNAAIATYSLSAALGATTVVNANVVGNGAEAGVDYGALLYRPGNPDYSYTAAWVPVVGNQLSLTAGLTNFQMKVDVIADGITEYGESVSFVIEQLASSTALVNRSQPGKRSPSATPSAATAFSWPMAC